MKFVRCVSTRNTPVRGARSAWSNCRVPSAMICGVAVTLALCIALGACQQAYAESGPGGAAGSAWRSANPPANPCSSAANPAPEHGFGPLYCWFILGAALTGVLSLSWFSASTQSPVIAPGPNEEPSASSGQSAEDPPTERAAHLESILNAATQISVIATDRTGLITFFNAGAEQMLGHRADEVVGRHTPELFHVTPQITLHGMKLSQELGQPVEGVEVLVARARRDGHETAEWTYVRKDKTQITVSLTVTAVRSDQGVLTGFLCVAQDITARKAEEDRQRQLAGAIEATADAVMLTDETGQIILVNPAFAQITGYAAEEVAGSQPRVLQGGQHPPEFYEDMWTIISAGFVWRGRVVNRRKDGPLYHADLTISPVADPDGRITGYVGVLRDVTQDIEFERQLRAGNAKLTEALEREKRVSAELGETMRRLEAATEKAQAASRAKTEFLANMSHELRTPLHGILSFADFGVKKYAKAPPEKLLGYFEKIKQSGESLLVLLNDLLDLAKLEAGKMTLEFVDADLGVLIAWVADEFSAQAAEHGLTIHRPDPEARLEVSLDELKIRQALRNLLSNAIKFSPDGGVIDIDVSRWLKSVVVSVRDQGPGIPEGELEAVFDKFIQSSKTKSGAGGTGLGLAICQEILTGHQGRIWAENNPDGGAVFLFELPLPETATSSDPGLTKAAGEAAVTEGDLPDVATGTASEPEETA